MHMCNYLDINKKFCGFVSHKYINEFAFEVPGKSSSEIFYMPISLLFK